MKKLRRKVYMVAGSNTISMGSGRKEFSPKMVMPTPETLMKEAGQATLLKIGGAQHVDECVVGNFMSARFNRQAHLGAFFPFIDEGLKGKPAISVEGACASGSLALVSGIKSVLAETAEVVLAIGVEVQNTVKAIYCADILAGAGWFQNRKNGQAYFFPGEFSDRAGAYFEKYGREKTRKAFARWFRNAIENARLCPTAQEYHNTVKDLEALGMTEPNGKFFVDHLSVYDCSKVSDGASAITIVSEEGLKRLGIPKSDAVEVVGFGHVEGNITQQPDDLTELTQSKLAVAKALESAGITKDQLGTAEIHDCFTIAAVETIEAMGFAGKGEAPDFILDGNTSRTGSIPINTTGGLIGWGHPTGGTGVHQAVTLLEQLTGKTGDAQITLSPNKPYGLSINMGGNDKTLVSIVYRNANA
ncbi:MAG: beta-ketoacyl synthase N-terminal-like domain-containing protein [Bacteroidetes bacterium]|nr:beta-ketoacyl synthase N-terminal-like domain-containing protein [Bacteroidota bacterium]